jgi:hypothetical protein
MVFAVDSRCRMSGRTGHSCDGIGLGLRPVLTKCPQLWVHPYVSGVAGPLHGRII